jgi:glutamate synthase (NADPH/NADH) large chain
VTVAHWEAELKALIERHAAETQSVRARAILVDWETERKNFLQVCPKEMLVHLKHPLTLEAGRMPAE